MQQQQYIVTQNPGNGTAKKLEKISLQKWLNTHMKSKFTGLRNKSNTHMESKLAEASVYFFPSKFPSEWHDSSVSAGTVSFKDLQDLGSEQHCFHSQP